MVAVFRQAARSNFKNFCVSFYLRGMRYMKTNNASSEFSTSSRAARRDLASQYLSQVLVDTNVLNQGVTARPSVLLASITLEREVRSAKTLRAALLRAFYYLNRLKDTPYLLFQKQKLTPSLSTSSRRGSKPQGMSYVIKRMLSWYYTVV